MKGPPWRPNQDIVVMFVIMFLVIVLVVLLFLD